MLPVYLMFSTFGMVGKGTAAAVAVGTLALAVKMYARLTHRWWFWCVIAAVATVNAFLIALVRLPNQNYSFAIVAPFGYADYLLVRLCIRTLEKRTKPV